MTTRRRIAVAVAALAAAGTLGACSGSPTPTASSSTTSSGSATTSASPSSTTTAASPSTTTTSGAQAMRRTKADLTKALLSLEDVPSGFAVDPPSQETGLGASSKDPKCVAFVRFSNATKAPGSTATAERSFSGGQDGPAVDETLDALGTPARVAALQATYRASIRACHRVNVAVPGVGTAPVTVQAVSPPAYGKNPLAARMTFSSGPLKGTELNLVTTGVGDTVLAMSFIGVPPEDVDAATSVAVEKATRVLGVGTGT